MSLRRVALPGVAGELFLSAMPGRDAPISDFLEAAAAARIGLVLCLVPGGEIAARSPGYASLLEGALPFSWRAHPIADFSTPEDGAEFARFIARAAEDLQAGPSLLLHCAAGIGRTGLAAICLRSLGLDHATAEARIRAAGSGPETAAQRAFAAAFRPALSGDAASA